MSGGATGEHAPGGYRLASASIELNAGRPVLELDVTNVGDRPVQVGSHAAFVEVNRALRFDRELARGHRLDVPAGTAVRFEPGESRPVALVPLGGAGLVLGHSGWSDGTAPDTWGDAARPFPSTAPHPGEQPPRAASPEEPT